MSRAAACHKEAKSKECAAFMRTSFMRMLPALLRVLCWRSEPARSMRLSLALPSSAQLGGQY